MIEIPTGPWAIAPQALEALQASAREARTSCSTIPARANQAPHMAGEVAILRLDGVLFRDPGMMAMMFGSSTAEFANQLEDLSTDPDVRAILVEIDSPGGEVRGVQAAAQAMAAANRAKPVGVLANGTMASAAVWIGLQAGTVAIADHTTQTGSVGVVATHIDVSGAHEQRGIKATEIVAGSYKRIASNYAPLTSAGRAELQRQVDALYAIFLGAVGAARGVTPDLAHKQFGDGRIFIGKEAVDVGLVDRIATRSEMLAELDRLANVPNAKRVSRPTNSAAVTRTPAFMAKQISARIEKAAQEGRCITAASALQELRRLGQLG